ncbi:MAG: GNAT family N-acetyltransferase [Polyangiales bacterium]
MGDGIDICRWVVDPESMRRGLGRRLLREVMGPHTRVRTGAANEPAIRLYESEGFRIVDAIHDRHIDGSTAIRNQQVPSSAAVVVEGCDSPGHRLLEDSRPEARDRRAICLVTVAKDHSAHAERVPQPRILGRVVLSNLALLLPSHRTSVVMSPA